MMTMHLPLISKPAYYIPGIASNSLSPILIKIFLVKKCQVIWVEGAGGLEHTSLSPTLEISLKLQ